MFAAATEKTGTSAAHSPSGPANTGASSEPKREAAKLRTEYVMPGDEWDNIDGAEFGGQSEILDIAVGELAVGLIYTGHQTSTIGNKPVEVHTATTREGSSVRLPIAASFARALDQGQVLIGDVIAIKRFDDVKKAGGVGKGQMMAIYGIKVQKRAASGE